MDCGVGAGSSERGYMHLKRASAACGSCAAMGVLSVKRHQRSTPCSMLVFVTIFDDTVRVTCKPEHTIQLAIPRAGRLFLRSVCV
jgi:hypothetical protein